MIDIQKDKIFPTKKKHWPLKSRSGRQNLKKLMKKWNLKEKVWERKLMSKQKNKFNKQKETSHKEKINTSNK